MTHEEIQAAIKRLRKISNGARGYNALEFVDAVIPDGPWIDGLTALLQQADPDAHMLLPVDADGEVIHIGDKVESVHREDGTVVGIQYYEGVRVLIAVRPRNWDTPSWCDPAEYRHYHKPTIEEVLLEFGDDVQRCCDTEDTIAEYAAKLREAMQDD